MHETMNLIKKIIEDIRLWDKADEEHNWIDTDYAIELYCDDCQYLANITGLTFDEVRGYVDDIVKEARR